MVSKSSTSFVLLIVFAVVLKANSHVEESRALGNDIDKLLQKLRAAVDKAVAQAQHALDEAVAKVNQTAQKVEDAAVKQMQSSQQKLEQQLDQLKQKAKDAGVDIDDCLGADEQRLVSLPDVYSDDLVHCVEDQILGAIKYAQDGLDKIKTVVDENIKQEIKDVFQNVDPNVSQNDIKTVVDDIENIKQEIKDCGHGWKSVKCLAKLAVKVEKDVTTLPAQIEADAVATAALIANLEPNVEKCASEKTDSCEKEGEQILEKIGLCVATKIVTF